MERPLRTAAPRQPPNQRRVLSLQSPLGAPYGIISEGSPEGTASYNALFLSAQKRLSGGTTVLANYTWSHCISDEWNGQVGNTGFLPSRLETGVMTGVMLSQSGDHGSAAGL